MGKSKAYIWYILFGVILLIIIAPSFLSRPASYIFIDSIGGVAPGINGHLLGTDTIGRDVLAGIISGAQVSLIIASVSLTIALILGFVFNMFTSYIGDYRIKLNVLQCIAVVVLSVIFYYYIFIAFNFTWYIILLMITLFLALLGIVIPMFSGLGKKLIIVPMDTIGQKIYELFRAVPKLVLLLIFIGLSPKNNVWTISLIIGFLMWPLFFRYIRLEILSEKGKERFTSLRNLGYSDARIIFSDFLPTMLPILTTPFIFAFVGVVFLEANLSFLGLGISSEVTWGTLLAEAKRNTSAWWLVVFPGACLFLLFYLLDRWLGEENKEMI